MHNSHSRGKSLFALGFTVIAWSLAPLWVVRTTGLADPFIVALYALIIAMAVAVVSSFLTRRHHLVAAFRTVHRSGSLLAAVGVGFLAFLVYPLFYFSALQTGPSLLVNLVNYLWPIIGLVLVAVVRREVGSLELLLAAGFGFAGASLALLTGAHGRDGDVAAHSLPYALAIAGALAYGAMSAFMSVRAPNRGQADGIGFFLVALCAGGMGCLIVLGGIAILMPELVKLDLSSGRGAALLTYAILHPISHFCWLIAIQDRRIPGFSSAFLVPVISTAVLAVVARDTVGSEVLSALTLVLCGILFASVRDRGVLVAFAVGLAATASMQVSTSLPALANERLSDEMLTMTEILIGLVAIFGGFVLTNSIARYSRLQDACAAFYARARDISESRVTADLDMLDERVLDSARIKPAEVPLELPERSPYPELTRVWAQVDLALANRVSPYEWLVLVIGACGVMLSLHFSAAQQLSPVSLIVRASATAMVVGLLFAVRDYDLNRPRRVVDDLLSLRRRFSFTVMPDSALAKRLLQQGYRGVDWAEVALVVLVFASAISIAFNLG